MAKFIPTEEIYAAALDEEALDRLPHLIKEAVGGRSSVICWFHPDGTPEMLGYSHFSAEQMNDYVNEFVDYDLWAKGVLNAQHDLISFGERFMSETTFDRSVLRNEFFRKYDDDTAFCIGGIQSTLWGKMLVGVHRSRAAGSFEEAELTRLVEITRHVKGALGLRGQLATSRRQDAARRAALDAVSTALVIVDHNGLVLEMNAEAEQLLRLGLNDFKLVSGSVTSSDQRLAAAIFAATLPREPRAECLVLNSQGASDRMITITPVAAGRALLAFREPKSGRSATIHALRRAFALTAAEADVAVSLSEGLDLEGIARSRKVSIATVQAQLKSLRTKMSARRQGEIIALVSRLSLLRD